MAKGLGKRELRKHLQELSNEQRVNHLLHLGESFESVQAYGTVHGVFISTCAHYRDRLT
jgi:hypothetical protein